MGEEGVVGFCFICYLVCLTSVAALFFSTMVFVFNFNDYLNI